MFEALVFVFLRGLLATFIAVLAAAAAMVVGFFGSGPGALFIGAFAAFTAFGWALLPAIRHSRALALVAAIAWVCLGASVSTLDNRPGVGWLIGPWLLATAMVGLLLALPHMAKPPPQQPAASVRDPPHPSGEVIPASQAPADLTVTKPPND